MTTPMDAPIDERHFQVIDGVLSPQPWMQWRSVGAISAPSRSASYGVTLTSKGGADVFGTLGTLFGSLFSSLTSLFGASSILANLLPNVSAAGNKNQLVHSLQKVWTNNTPVDQWVYGLITRGGCRVTLQARSRGGLTVRSGQRTQWQALTDFENDGAGLWPLSDQVYVTEIADEKVLRLGGPTTITDVPVSPGDHVRIKFRSKRDAAFNGTNGGTRLALGNATATPGAAGVPILTVPFGLAAMPSPNVWYPWAVADYVIPAGVKNLSLQFTRDGLAGNAYLDDVFIDIGRGELPDSDVNITDASMFGIGGDIGRGGTLAIGTDFAVMEQRMNSVTFPLCPERPGWTRLVPGETFVARVDLRFISEFWENTSIDGGDSGTESSFESGETRLDLFAVPVI